MIFNSKYKIITTLVVRKASDVQRITCTSLIDVSFTKWHTISVCKFVLIDIFISTSVYNSILNIIHQ